MVPRSPGCPRHVRVLNDRPSGRWFDHLRRPRLSSGRITSGHGRTPRSRSGPSAADRSHCPHLTPSERSAREGHTGSQSVNITEVRLCAEVRFLHPASVEAIDLRLREPEGAQVQAAMGADVALSSLDPEGWRPSVVRVRELGCELADRGVHHTVEGHGLGNDQRPHASRATVDGAGARRCAPLNPEIVTLIHEGYIWMVAGPRAPTKSLETECARVQLPGFRVALE